jgi:hypothetical protein
MKSFRNIRENSRISSIIERNGSLSYVIKDRRNAEAVKKELEKFVRSKIELERDGNTFLITLIPRNKNEEQIIRSFMDDADIEIKKESFINSLIRSKMISENVSHVTASGETIDVTPEHALKIIEIHDSLNEENQEIFMEMLIHSKETFDQAISFCETFSEI